MRRLLWILVLVLAGAGCHSTTRPATAPPGATTTWQPLATAPLPPHDGIFLTLGDQLVALGGMSWVDCAGMMSCPIGRPLHSAAAYDPHTDSWRRLGRLPWSITDGGGIAVEGDRACFPGSGDERTANSIVCYDLSADHWWTYPAPPINAANIDRMVIHGSALYATTLTSYPEVTPVQRLDLHTGRWRALPETGLGASTARGIFWTDRGLVVAGYARGIGPRDHRPPQAVARFAHGRWHDYDPPDERISPATYTATGDRVLAPFPRSGPGLSLDLRSGRWSVITSGDAAAGLATGWPRTEGELLLQDGRVYDADTGRAMTLTTPPQYEGGSGALLGGDVYVLSDHSRLWKWPPTSADQPD